MFSETHLVINCIGFMIIAVSLRQAVDAGITVTDPPQNAVLQSGDNIQLSCEISGTYSGYFEWRQFKVSTSLGLLIYDIYTTSSQTFYTNHSGFPSNKYSRVSEYSLQISSATVSDGAQYKCNFLVESVSLDANVTIVDLPTLTSTVDEMNVSSSAIFNCSVLYGALSSASSQIPQLELTLGGRVVESVDVLVPAGSESNVYLLSKTVNYTAVASDANAVVQCLMSTRSPAFTRSTSMRLKILSPPQQPTLSPLKSTFRIGDIITCSTVGYPTPTVAWQSVTGSMSGGALMTNGPNVTITSSMIGSNTLRCIAVNRLGSVQTDISFTVIAPVVTTTLRPSTLKTTSSTTETGDVHAGAASSSEGGLSSGAKVGIGVGIGVGIPVLLVIILLAVFCTRRRRQAAHKEPDQIRRPPSYDHVVTNSNPSSVNRLNTTGQSTSPPPEYNPRPARTQDSVAPVGPVPTARISRVGSQNSGYGDLGAVGFGTAEHAVPRRNDHQPTQNVSMDQSFGPTVVGPKMPKVSKQKPQQGYANRSFNIDSETSPHAKPVPATKPSKLPAEFLSGQAYGVEHPKGWSDEKRQMNDIGRSDSPVFVVDDNWRLGKRNNLENVELETNKTLDKSFDDLRGDPQFPAAGDVSLGSQKPVARPRSRSSYEPPAKPRDRGGWLPTGTDVNLDERGDQLFDGLMQPPLPSSLPPNCQADRSFEYLEEPAGERFRPPEAVNPAVNLGEHFNRRGDRSFDDLCGYDGRVPQEPHAMPRAIDRSTDNLRNTLGSVISTAPLIQQHNRASLDNPSDTKAPGLVPGRLPTFPVRGGRSVGDRSFDDNLSPPGSVHDISTRSNTILQFKNASKSVDV